jgi:arabinogalactan oligomer/maltooligosaccharide transport system permease protein
MSVPVVPPTGGVSGGPAVPPPPAIGAGDTAAAGRSLVPYLYLAPVVISALVFTVFPFLYTFYISFTNYGLAHFVEFNFVGLDQYREVFAGGSEFFPVLGWTFEFMILTTVLNVGFGIFLALLLNHPGLPERNLYRTLLIIPWALPFILLVQVFTGLFNNQGPINLILTNLGLDRVQWIPQFGDPTTARVALLLVNLWFSYPFFMTVGLAALQAIPQDLYEVADLDGASWWSKFRDITWPFLLSAVTPLLITQAAFQFNNSGIIVLFTSGLPQGEPGSAWGLTDTLASYAYELFYNQRDYGLTAAYGTITFLFIAVMLGVSSLVTRSFQEEEA